jgi:5-methylcytosine-specific restriction endonuclease McrA
MSTEAQKLWYQANKESIIKSAIAWRKANKQRVNDNCVKRRRKTLNEAKEHLGGKCVECGTTERLEFDHINPADRTDAITNIMGKEALYEELTKCQLLCHSCHKERSRRQQAAAWALFTSQPLEVQERLLRSVHL